jgi:pimeloyl-ACP methyl ester carboxylesterase
MSTETIYVLPGMGADSTMYSGVWRTLPNCLFIEWPRYKNEHSIENIGRRVVEEAGIKDGAILVGSSLGGIVACEIAKLRNLRRLFLVGGAKRKEEINDFLALIHPLADLLPIEFIQIFDHVIPVPPDAQKVVDGGHLIAMTHAQECVDFIVSRISR